MKQFFYLFLIIMMTFFGNSFLFAQNITNNKLSYEKIEKKIDSLQNDKEKVIVLINHYISKSKLEKNNESLFYAYRYASKYNPAPKKFKYADSALTIAKNSNNTLLITDAYLNKGTVYMDERFYQRALDNILLANKYSIELKDDYITNKTIYFIAQNKIYLGNYEDANAELKICIDYFKRNLNDKSSLGKNSQMYYIYSLMSYIDTNTKIGKQKENKTIIKDATNYLKNNNLNLYIPYFISIEGTEAYYTGNYPLSIKKLKEAIKLYNDPWSHITEVYYLGLANWKLGNHAVAIKYLEEIDKEYEKEKKLDPQFRSAYELLIKYNDSVGNRDKQLEYINKLMLLDRSYERNFKYLYSKINKEYDTQKLIAEKNRIEQSLNTRTYIGVFLLVLIIVLIFYGYRFYTLQKIYKARFYEIVENKTGEEAIDPQDIMSSFSFLTPQKDLDLEFYNKIPNLKPNYVKDILEQLEKFEKEEMFTDSQLSIKLLSENFGTNYVYLSKIINEYRDKNFNMYINDLRLEYAVNLLKDKKYLHYDIKELSAISGFTTPNNFSTNFVRKFKIKPSYFIKLLKENL